MQTIEEIKKEFEEKFVDKGMAGMYTCWTTQDTTKVFNWLVKKVSRVELPVMQKTADSADEIFIKGKIEGLEEARWQVVFALPHIDPNGRLEKKTKYLMDEMKKVQEELRAKL